MNELNTPESMIENEMRAAYSKQTDGILKYKDEDGAIAAYHHALDNGSTKQEAEKAYHQYFKTANT